MAERLTAVTDGQDTPIGRYAYDPFGRRLKKTTATETIYFQHGEEGLLAEYDASGNPLATYGWEPQGLWGTNPVWKKEGSNTYFYSNDHLGTPQVLTDSSGQIVWKGRAEAFGKTTVEAGSTVSNNLRFPGQYFDAETGMHYNYFRDYEPTIGRYLQSDPIGLAGGINGYAYASGNGLRFLDYTGLNSRVCCRDLPVVGLLGYKHCYIETIGSGGRETWGLMGGAASLWFDGQPMPGCGQVAHNNGFDIGGPCGAWSPCDDCVKKVAAGYANPTVYDMTEGPNSNTFASTVAKKCGLQRPEIPEYQTPGWGKDPAPAYPGPGIMPVPPGSRNRGCPLPIRPEPIVA